ncbi:DUF1398 domain-containing protein [Larkinella rosea]|uniref:DUF1398 domain-containing protein n=1 Tax=Larkinella rosea TaxID=2025312 RepID=A0A3P1C168_9BACT|nr:DUF1398 family protein [Larkinella rosea]RRB07022.1 DUF1398 domain-containing protein [Larkinella rosea]
MFTIEQIKQAHSKVRTGADFPAYIQEIKSVGVRFYTTYVTDGHTDYVGKNDFKTTAPARYPTLPIADHCDLEQFKAELKDHQQGKTDPPMFFRTCAELGIAEWTVDLIKMTCTYHDKAGQKILAEKIPS